MLSLLRFSFGVLRFWPPEDTAAVDGVLHLMGDRVRRVGSSAKHRTEAGGQGGCLTATVAHSSPILA